MAVAFTNLISDDALEVFRGVRMAIMPEGVMYKTLL